jgi:hypothetical protein
MTTTEILKLLNDFVPFDENDPIYDNESYFYKPMDELRLNSDFELAIEPIFKTIEKFPSTDFGSPGPFVHTLESFAGHYESYLFDSLKRRPTPLTIWMLNRIINAEQNIIIKQNLIDRLHSFIHHPLADKETIDTINGFIAFQNKIKK